VVVYEDVSPHLYHFRRVNLDLY